MSSFVHQSGRLQGQTYSNKVSVSSECFHQAYVPKFDAGPVEDNLNRRSLAGRLEVEKRVKGGRTSSQFCLCEFATKLEKSLDLRSKLVSQHLRADLIKKLIILTTLSTRFRWTSMKLGRFENGLEYIKTVLQPLKLVGFYIHASLSIRTNEKRALSAAEVKAKVRATNWRTGKPSDNLSHNIDHI